MHWTLLWLSSILFLLLSPHSFSQTGTVTSGGESTGPGGTISYSYGQVFFCTISGSDTSVAQGVQQPYEISVITAIEGSEGITASLTAFPNPTKDHISLLVKGIVFENIDFGFYDMHGKLIDSHEIVQETTIIPLDGLASGIYFLKVIANNKELKVFQIIKN
jgi:hypothetical protein